MDDVVFCRSIRPHNVIVLGDFNLTPDQLDRLQHQASSFLKTLHRIQNPSPRPRPNCSRNIDYIFSSLPSSTTMSTDDDPMELSDHDPVVAEFSCAKKVDFLQFPNRHFNYVTVQNALKLAGPMREIPP